MAVVRATEILLALIIDKLLFNARQTSIGAVLVLTGVSLMSCHMHIQDRIDDFFLSKKESKWRQSRLIILMIQHDVKYDQNR